MIPKVSAMSNPEPTPLCSQESATCDEVTLNENSKDLTEQEIENGSKAAELEDLASEIQILDTNLTTGTNILGNKVLEEILNEKKVALLRSPEVIKYLQQKSTTNK